MLPGTWYCNYLQYCKAYRLGSGCSILLQRNCCRAGQLIKTVFSADTTGGVTASIYSSVSGSKMIVHLRVLASIFILLCESSSTLSAQPSFWALFNRSYLQSYSIFYSQRCKSTGLVVMFRYSCTCCCAAQMLTRVFSEDIEGTASIGSISHRSILQYLRCEY